MEFRLELIIVRLIFAISIYRIYILVEVILSYSFYEYKLQGICYLVTVFYMKMKTNLV